MPSGGARNRSGPQRDPNSGRSDRRNLAFTQLPSGGRTGRVPKFPLTDRRVYRWEVEGKIRRQVFDAESTEIVRDREAELWKWAWRTPQAVAWDREPWRWQAVAHWVRTSVLCETDEATASDRGSLHRFADQIGLTPAGLRENGWAIAVDEVTPAREARAAQVEAVQEKPAPPVRRMRPAAGGGN